MDDQCVDDQSCDKNKLNEYGCLLLSKVDNMHKPRLSLKSCFFSISLLVCEFNPHRQTCYQTSSGTYPPLNSWTGTVGAYN